MSEKDSIAKKYSFFDSFPEGCQVISPEYEYLYVNDAVAEQGKSTKEELLGFTMMEKYPGIERTPLFAKLEQCMKTKKHENMLNEFSYPDGTDGMFELRLRGVEEGVLILSEDVTEREKLVAESTKLFSYMVDREARIKELKEELEALKKNA